MKINVVRKAFFRELRELREKMHQDDYTNSWNRSVKWTEKGRLCP